MHPVATSHYFVHIPPPSPCPYPISISSSPPTHPPGSRRIDYLHHARPLHISTAIESKPDPNALQPLRSTSLFFLAPPDMLSVSGSAMKGRALFLLTINFSPNHSHPNPNPNPNHNHTLTKTPTVASIPELIHVVHSHGRPH